jgi:D-glycerate 3-kinase
MARKSYAQKAGAGKEIGRAGEGAVMSDQRDATDVITGYLTSRLSKPSGVLVIGICGAQGSGKSYVTRQTASRLTALGHACATLSLDDLYLTHAERTALAREVHPLLATRGPPGTHEVSLGLSILGALREGQAAAIPAFDKLADERLPRDRWTAVSGPVDIVLFEGWCLGATPQPPQDLIKPVNALERVEDPDGVWRAYVNTALAGPYQTLFGQLDALIMLKAPSFDVVCRWRTEQEASNVARASGQPRRQAMSETEISRFIQYYERITRHMMAETPSRADLVLALDKERRVVGEDRRS